MALRRVETVMPVQRVDGHASGQRDTGRAGAAGVEQQRGVAAKGLGSMVADHPAERDVMRPRGHADQIQYAKPGLQPDLFGQVGPGMCGDEGKRGHRNASFVLAGARNFSKIPGRFP